MTKSRNKKKFKISKLGYLSLALIAILIISQIVSIAYIGKLRESVSSLEDRYFLSFVNQVETQRYKKAVVAVSEQRIYIPDAHIYIPLAANDPDILYDSRQLNGAGSKTLYLAIAQVIGYQRSLDDSVESHSCDKMIMVSDTEQSGGMYTFVKEIPTTKDGLKYVYLHTKDRCGIYSQSAWGSAKEVAENIQNY